MDGGVERLAITSVAYMALYNNTTFIIFTDIKTLYQARSVSGSMSWVWLLGTAFFGRSKPMIDLAHQEKGITGEVNVTGELALMGCRDGIASRGQGAQGAQWLAPLHLKTLRTSQACPLNSSG